MCRNASSEKMLAQHHGEYCFVTLKHSKHLDLHHLRHLISSHKLKLLLRNIIVLLLDTTQCSAWTSSYKLVDSCNNQLIASRSATCKGMACEEGH